MRALLPLLALVACKSDGVDLDKQDGATQVVDVRRDFPEPPAGGQQWRTPDYTIPAYTEKQFCYFTTYEGPTLGIHGQFTYQSDGGHHIVIAATNASQDDYPDGTVLDCTEADAMPMTELDPLFVGGELGSAENGWEGELVLPEGMASQLKEGTRIILQSHYLNYTGDDILVTDAINLDVMQPDDVQTWVAPFVHVITEHPIPQGKHTQEFDCTWDTEYDVLFLGGHMHEWGSAFSTSMTPAGGSSSLLYEVPSWDPLMRDAPSYNYYGPGELHVMPGDSFTTHCEWDNDTDHVLDFPEEMCVTFGMVYPSKVPVVCSP